ncbi:MAG: type IV pilus secretin PilQ [Xanthomonadaceae bacterium]|jgi:type IV pilus assembly protein PilQ|nr:type IV pilus secretin PilQ [Xanthomonadaceae bacterium]
MSTTIANQPRRPDAARTRGRFLARLLGTVLAVAPGLAAAQNILESVTVNPGPGGQVDIVMSLAQPASDPKLFTTDSPPRIAIDFDNTRNGLAERRINVGVGAATAISAIEAAGRTRLVVELVRPTAYTTRMDGNNLVLSVGADGGSMASGVVASNDPTKAVSGRPEVANVDFRRGKNGEGRIIVTFTSDGVAADLSRQGSNVAVELRNVALPPQFAQRLDVTDFATPVETVETRATPNGARMEIRVNGDFEQLAYQTGAEYVVEIAPKRVESEAEKALKEPEYTGERVTFNFQDIPVRSVLQLIADVSQLNVVVADSVSGNVTLRLVNTPWDQALDIILQAKGLDKRRRGGVIWVAPTAEIAAREQALEDARIALEDRAPLISEYIPINYGNAKDIAELLTSDALRAQQAGGAQQSGGASASQKSSGFLSNRGSVTFDERTNTLLINDTAEKVAEIRDLIRLLDRPVDQVLIESRIVIADQTFGRELGARFGLTGAYEDRQGNVISTGGNVTATDNMLNEAIANRRAGRTSALPVGVPSPPGGGILVPSLGQRLNVNLPVVSPAGSFALAVLGQDYLLDLELSALSEEGKGEVISSPRVITANQREALIRQGDEIGYVTISPQQGGNSIPIPNVQFKDVLLELKVTPTITQDQRVFLAMNVKKDEVSGFIDTSIGQVPQINKREINTAVLVENGQTVVLGGVYEFRSRQDLSKVPFLGDLPAVGNFFKNTSSSSDKAELLIFVTPKILEQGNR